MAATQAVAGYVFKRLPIGNDDRQPFRLPAYRLVLWHCRPRDRHTGRLEVLLDRGILRRFHHVLHLLQREFDAASRPSAVASDCLYGRKRFLRYHRSLCRPANYQIVLTEYRLSSLSFHHNVTTLSLLFRPVYFPIPLVFFLSNFVVCPNCTTFAFGT